MRRLVAAEKGEDDETIPDEPPPLIGDAHHALATWMHFRLHHVYPDAGGYNDQDADLMDDWLTLNVWYIRLSIGVEVYGNLPPPELFPDVRTMMHG